MASDHITFTFGRMNPPTTGHSKLIDTVHKYAAEHGHDHQIIVSHSQDKHKNPLSAEQKLHYLNHIHPNIHFEASTKEHPHFLAQLKKFHQQGYKHATMFVGSDRVEEMKKLAHKYNGPEGEYNFTSLHIKSAGKRDPDAEGVEGMSGTKMRTHAGNNDYDEFRKGLHSSASDAHAKKLYDAVRKGMGLKEEEQKLSFGKFLAENIMKGFLNEGMGLRR